jgi:hypothetical protein
VVAVARIRSWWHVEGRLEAAGAAAKSEAIPTALWRDACTV